MTSRNTPLLSIRLDSADTVQRQLRDVGYLSDLRTSSTLHLASQLAKPVLVEGPAGTGKTELAKSVAAMTGARLIRLQCYEGLDEAKALYEWNYKKQLLHLYAQRDGATGTPCNDAEGDIFGREFLLERPVLSAIRSDEPVVLLIDEVDRIDFETEALLLEVLSDFQVSIPELGTVAARNQPMVLLTSNGTRDLSDALKRRCLFLFLDYPSVDREREIIDARVPGIERDLRDQVSTVVQALRTIELKKPPSVSETLDWARTLMVLGVHALDADCLLDTINVLLKCQSDIDTATAALASSSILVAR